jgi:hypothetical protein
VVVVPVLAKLVIMGMISASRLWLGRRMAQMLAGALAGRDTHVVAGAACAGKELKGLRPGITWTTRLGKGAARYELPPARTGRRGRPHAEGDKLPCQARLAADAAFTPAAVTRYGKTATIGAAAITWCGTAPSVSGPTALGILPRQAVCPRSARRTVTG